MDKLDKNADDEEMSWSTRGYMAKARKAVKLKVIDRRSVTSP